MIRRRLIVLSGAAILLGCDSGASDRKDATRARLVGTWLRETEASGQKMRRVIVLSADKSFLEFAKIVAADGAAETEAHKGEWFFDGTNFKRKYTHLNAVPLSSSRMTFATFRLEPSSADEIVGVDDVRQMKVVYRRVPDGTRP